MSPEEREVLNRAVLLGEENNKLLRYIKRSMRVSQIVSFVYWVIIIGSAIGAFYFLKPYIGQIESLYGSASSVLKNIK